MIPLARCQHEIARPRPSYLHPDADSWPCITGGSIAVIASTRAFLDVSCMVFYNTPERVSLVNDDEHADRIGFLYAAIEGCEREFPRFVQPYRPAIRLMALARCVYGSYPGPMPSQMITQPIKLRGLAVFSSYREPRDERSGYGLEAEYGRFVLQCSAEVPIMNLQEPDPQLHICYAAMMSNTYL